VSPEELAFKLGVKQLFEQNISPDLSIYIHFVPGEKAFPTWQEHRKLAPALGYWPLVLGNDRTFEQTKECFEHSAKSPVKRPSPHPLQTAQKFFESRAEEVADELPTGPWPIKSAAPHSFYLPAERDKRAVIGLIRASNSVQVLQVLRFRDWKAFPSVHEHVTVHDYWNLRYGSEIVCLSSEVLELQVKRRPANREAALALAKEQYLYCSDIVEQGTGTIQGLAAGLMVSDAWLFWWD